MIRYIFADVDQGDVRPKTYFIKRDLSLYPGFDYKYSPPILRLIERLIEELAWRGGCVMDCHATNWGSIPRGNGVKTELHVLRKGQ